MEKIRSKVLSIAHQIKANFETWGQAQKAAWMIVKLNLSIEQEIAFVTKEGVIREAKALFAPNLETIEKGFVRFIEWVSEGVEQWRSFRIERLLV